MKQIKILLLLLILVGAVFNLHVYAEETGDSYDGTNYNSTVDSDSIDGTDNYDDNTIVDDNEDDEDYYVSPDDSTITEDTSKNIEDTSNRITNGSDSLIFVEIFCGLIGIIMIVLANKTTG